MNDRFDDLKLRGINTEEGFGYTGNPVKYLAALQRFYRRSDGNTEAIDAAAADRNGEELTRLVHALKSNAKTIGADRLAGLAEQMEILGTSGKYDEAYAVKDDLIKEYNSVTDIIRPYGEMEEVHPESEISAAEAEEAGARLIAAIEDFDDGESLKQIEILMRYPFRFTLINVLKTAKGDILDFEYNRALLKVRRVVSQIED